jgi:hypothetical protein
MIHIVVINRLRAILDRDIATNHNPSRNLHPDVVNLCEYSIIIDFPVHGRNALESASRAQDLWF